jgi:hypothetical protein
MRCFSLLDTLLTGIGLIVFLPIAWFTIGPVWGPWCWLLFVFIVCGNVTRILICVGVAYLIYSMIPAQAQDRSGWGALDSNRGEIYMGLLFDTAGECQTNLMRNRPTYGTWQCKYMSVLAPHQILIPPANAKEGVRCSKNGGTTVCR